MDISEAFRTFESSAQLLAASEIRSRSDEAAFGSRYTELLHNGASLRLVWDGKDQELALEISHRPPNGDIAGWLKLFSARCKDGVLVETGNEDTSFASSIEYGLELMGNGA